MTIRFTLPQGERAYQVWSFFKKKRFTLELQVRLPVEPTDS